MTIGSQSVIHSRSPPPCAAELQQLGGELTNEELLLGLGFVLHQNPFDRLVVPPRALAYALQASVESFQRALALNDNQDFLSEADAKTLASKQVSASPAVAPRFHTAQPSTFTHSTMCLIQHHVTAPSA
jgi:hypothetical protein